jgi:O-antigen/teichoic acid export membrane protein
MKKKFLSNLILLMVLNLMVKPFWLLGIDRTVQNVVGAEDYGFYYVIFNFSFIFNILLDFGITNYNNRNIAQHSQLLNKHFSGIVIIKLLLAVVYSVVTFSVAFFIGFNAYQLAILGVLCFNQFLLSFILYLRSNISGLLMFRTDSFLSILDRVLMIIICGALLWGHITTQPFRIEWFVYAQTVSYFITALIALFIVVRKAAFSHLSWNFAFFVIIIKKSLPFALLVMLMAFYNRIDPVMIERLLPESVGKEQVGIYASAYRLLDAGNMIAFLFAGLLLPLFSRMIQHNESVLQIVRMAFSLLIVLSIIVAFGSYSYATELMRLMYHAHVEESARVFSILMFGFIAISSSYVFGTLLTANGSLKLLNIIAASGMAINLTINFLLVPRLMAEGSAWASVITQFTTALLQVWFAWRLFRWKADRRYLLSLITFVIGVGALAFVTRNFSDSWVINITSMGIGSMLLAALLKLLDFKNFISILKSDEVHY